MTGPGRGDAVTVRLALVADADALARCHLACWQETYAGLVDAQRLAQAVAAVGERAERWRQILTDSPGTLLAVAAGQPVGFGAAGPQRDPDLRVALELYALYVRRSHQRSGIGHRLLEAVVGDADCSLWVLAINARARTFYAQHGFVADGTRKVDDFFGPEIRMLRSAAGGAAVLAPPHGG
nr:GNAT family N-acetyltransferase [uncultured Friedmanniella sp.]